MAPTSPTKLKQRQWPNVYTRVHRSGQVSYVVDVGLVEGQRQRHSFKTKAEANTFAELKRVERQNHGAAALNLSQETRQDALRAEQLLRPHGVTLTEAAHYYAEHVLAYRQAPLLREVVERMVTDAQKNERRERTVADLRYRLTIFAEQFPERRLSDLTVEDLQDWLEEQEGWSARSKINYLTKISQLYNYALRHNWVDANLAERLARPDTEDKEPGIFTVAQARSLLEQAPAHGLLAYIALGLFAGLRSAELMRLEAGAIKLADRSIVVGASVAKKRSRRVVEMGDALYAWLQVCPPMHGPIVDPHGLRKQLKALTTAAGLAQWPHNGLRHSFGSYHLAWHGDANQTATQMGHRDSSVVHNHYKALVLRTEAEKYWNLRPKPIDGGAAR